MLNAVVASTCSTQIPLLNVPTITVPVSEAHLACAEYCALRAHSLRRSSSSAAQGMHEGATEFRHVPINGQACSCEQIRSRHNPAAVNRADRATTLRLQKAEPHSVDRALRCGASMCSHNSLPVPLGDPVATTASGSAVTQLAAIMVAVQGKGTRKLPSLVTHSRPPLASPSTT